VSESHETPTVGRIVHYVSYGTPGGEYTSRCRAAVVTEVSGPEATVPGLVSVAVLNPTGLFFDEHLPQGAPGEGGTWHWPERA
jgi:hypothetical protein